MTPFYDNSIENINIYYLRCDPLCFPVFRDPSFSLTKRRNSMENIASIQRQLAKQSKSGIVLGFLYRNGNFLFAFTLINIRFSRPNYWRFGSICFQILIIGIFCFTWQPQTCYSSNDNLTILFKQLHDKDLSVRRKAAQTLGDLRDPSAVEPLIIALKDEISSVRFDAAEALGKIKDPRAVKPLVTALKDKDGIVQSNANSALIRIGASGVEQLIAELIKLKHNDDSLIIQLKVQILNILGRIKDTRSFNVFIDLLKDKNDYMRAEAAKALGELKDPRAISHLKEALVNEKSCHSIVSILKVLKKMDVSIQEQYIPCGAAIYKDNESNKPYSVVITILTPSLEYISIIVNKQGGSWVVPGGGDPRLYETIKKVLKNIGSE
jgi:hypothetical protein